MDAVLDIIWEYMAAGFHGLAETFFAVLQNFHFLGPAVLIALLAMITVGVTKLLNKWITTKRYSELEKTFQYWARLRDEAMRCEDREKGQVMARNIDQAELNKAYYDYFFEGFMLGIARKVIPVFFMFAFINEYYRTERLVEIFGQGYVLQIPVGGGEPVLIGGVFWYIISLMSGYLIWFIVARLHRSAKGEARPAPVESIEEMVCR
ncbi:MAG: hypothetical protein ACWGOX_05415 [Desulforhopalus sp.]